MRIREIARLPEYLNHIKYRNPGSDPAQPTLFQWTNDTDLEFFQWMQTQSDTLARFNASMAKSIETERDNIAGKTIVDVYPFEAEVANADGSLPSLGEPLVVDVGGGYGHLLQEIRTRLPHVKGKMVLEDLPETVRGAVPMENVDIVSYNFFTQQQPVKGEKDWISCCPSR